jgi:hypothetical protein
MLSLVGPKSSEVRCQCTGGSGSASKEAIRDGFYIVPFSCANVDRQGVQKGGRSSSVLIVVAPVFISNIQCVSFEKRTLQKTAKQIFGRSSAPSTLH